MTATYDTASKKLSWKGNYSGLTGPATMAHFHGPAEAGKNAGVAVAITPSTSPFESSATLTDAQAADLIAGRWYVNVHAPRIPAGKSAASSSRASDQRRIARRSIRTGAAMVARSRRLRGGVAAAQQGE